MLTVALLIAPVSPNPKPDLDSSWEFVLNRAHQLGLHFGSDLVFTYGPWGFLDSPMALSPVNLVLAALFAAFAASVAWLSIWAAVRAWPGSDASGRSWLAAAVATGVVLLATPASWGPSALLVLGITVLAALFVGLRGRPRHQWMPAFVGGTAAFALQVKFSEGVALAVVAALCGLFSPANRWRRTAEVAVTYVVVLVATWLLIGQRLGELPSWLVGSARVAAGYSEAMSIDSAPNILVYLMVAIAVIVLLVLVVRFARTELGDARSGSRRRAVGVALIALAIAYLGFKQSTTRRGGDAYEHYFYLMLVPAGVLLVARARRTVYSLVPVVLAVALAWNGNAYLMSPAKIRDRAAVAVQLVASPHDRRNYLDDARRVLRDEGKIPPELIALIGRHPVNVDGVEQALPWAYGLTWDPMPIFQNYSAYTESLDQRNTTWLRRAPDDLRILRPRNVTIDSRDTLWDPPAYNTEEVCRTEVEGASIRYLLLRKTPSRCGKPRVLRTRHVRAGETVQAPAVRTDQMLTLSFEPDGSLGQRVVTTIFKPTHHLVLTVDGDKHRVPRALATGPLLMTIPRPAKWPSLYLGGTVYRRVAANESGTMTFSVRDYR